MMTYSTSRDDARAALLTAVAAAPFGDVPDALAPPFSAGQLADFLSTSEELAASRVEAMANDTLRHLEARTRGGIERRLRDMEYHADSATSSWATLPAGLRSALWSRYGPRVLLQTMSAELAEPELACGLDAATFLPLTRFAERCVHWEALLGRPEGHASTDVGDSGGSSSDGRVVEKWPDAAWRRLAERVASDTDAAACAASAASVASAASSMLVPLSPATTDDGDGDADGDGGDDDGGEESSKEALLPSPLPSPRISLRRPTPTTRPPAAPRQQEDKAPRLGSTTVDGLSIEPLSVEARVAGTRRKRGGGGAAEDNEEDAAEGGSTIHGHWDVRVRIERLDGDGAHRITRVTLAEDLRAEWPKALAAAPASVLERIGRIATRDLHFAAPPIDLRGASSLELAVKLPRSGATEAAPAMRVAEVAVVDVVDGAA